MLAVDTNVVVRLLVNDDARQGAVARRLFESNEIWCGVTVLPEVAVRIAQQGDARAGGEPVA